MHQLPLFPLRPKFHTKPFAYDPRNELYFRPTTQLTYIRRYIEDLEILAMSKNGYQAAQNKSWTQSEFVNYRLDKTEVAQYKLWTKENADDIIELLTQTIGQGIKVSCSWDAKSQCFVGSFSDNREKSPNSGKILTSRSNDWLDSLALNLFKDLVIYTPTGIWTNRNEGETYG